MSVLGFCEWLGATSISVGIRESTLTFPIIESIHVLGLCLFLGMATMLDLRLLGVALKSVRVSEIYARLLPWTWAGAVIMVVSGIFTFLNDPARYYQNVFFRIKVVFLVAAVLNAWLFDVGIYRSIATWDTDVRTPKRARMAGILGCCWILARARTVTSSCTLAPQPGSKARAAPSQ